MVANGGDVAKEAAILPVGAEIPNRPERSDIISVLAGPGPLFVLQLQWDPQSTAGSSIVPRARLLASDDLGSTWRSFPGDLPVDATCLYTVAMDYSTRDTLYATSCQGIFRWTGALWEKTSSRKAERVLAAYGNPEMLRATEAGRVIESLDGGRNWRDLGLNNAAVVAGSDPRNPRQMYALSVYKGLWMLSRGTGEPGQWTQLPTPDGLTAFYASMAVDGSIGEIYLVVRNPQTGVDHLWRSPNPGTPDASQVRWEHVHEFGKGVDVQMFAAARGTAGLALYGTLDYRPGGGVVDSWWEDAGEGPMPIRSLDGGRTWEALVVQ